jgi:hypothetical protein
MSIPFLIRRLFLPLLAILLPMLVSAQTSTPQQPKNSEPFLAEFRKGFERPRVALDVQIVASEVRDGLVHENVTVTSEAGVHVPVLIIHREKDTKRRPAVVCLHGLGEGRKTLAERLRSLPGAGLSALLWMHAITEIEKAT